MTTILDNFIYTAPTGGVSHTHTYTFKDKAIYFCACHGNWKHVKVVISRDESSNLFKMEKYGGNRENY